MNSCVPFFVINLLLLVTCNCQKYGEDGFHKKSTDLFDLIDKLSEKVTQIELQTSKIDHLEGQVEKDQLMIAHLLEKVMSE